MRKPDPALLAQAALHVVGAAALVALGVDVGFRLDEPKPVIRTVVLAAAPACREIAAELQAERAAVEYLAEAEENVDHAAAEIDDVVLTADADAIVKQAKLLDTALRAEQKRRLALATAQVTTDAVVADCAPERPE